MMKVCSLGKRNKSKSFHIYFFPLSVSAHWRYRFFDVQFSSGIGDVSRPMQICLTLFCQQATIQGVIM